MRAERRHFTAVQKLAILREHLIEKRPISDVCQKHKIQPTLFYLWQKKLFENGAMALEANPAGPGRPGAEARKIEALEAKVQQKNEVMAELMGEHVALKKSLGQI